MNKRAYPLRHAIAIAAAALGALAVNAPAAAASGLAGPLSDSNIDGTLTFCNSAGQPVTSGSLDTRPFAWKTISSSPAPKGFTGRNARATLDVYQPIQFEDPGDWSGSNSPGLRPSATRRTQSFKRRTSTNPCLASHRLTRCTGMATSSFVCTSVP